MSLPTPPDPARGRPAGADPSLAATRALIQRRKAADHTFGGVGILLIVLSLGVLGILIAKLFVDGTRRMLETHEVKATGIAPMRNEVVGTLRRAPAAGPWQAGWELHADTLELRAGSPTIDIEALKVRRVAVRGDIPPAGERIMSVSAITAIPDNRPGEEIAGSPNVVGKVESGYVDRRQQELVLTLVPEPLRLLTADGSVPAIDPSLDGARVAVDAGGRRGRNPAMGTLRADGVERLVSKSFFASMPSQVASRAGILPAMVGTIMIMLVTMVVAVPLGVAAGVYLEEYAPKNRLTSIIEINIANLAGVPSIIWGLAGLGLFIFALHMERSVLAAGMTLGLLVLPIVIISTREAIRAIPNTIREAAIGLGATKWQTVRYHIIPYSMSGILTGSIIALSRAIGETAPLVCIGAVGFITFLPSPPLEWRVSDAAAAAHVEAVKADPDAPPPAQTLHVQPFEWLNSKFTVVPMQIFDWVSRPQRDFHDNAAAASIVLVVLTLGLNGIAIWLRYRLRRAIKW